MYWVENSVKNCYDVSLFRIYKKEKTFLLNCLLKDIFSSEKDSTQMKCLIYNFPHMQTVNLYTKAILLYICFPVCSLNISYYELLCALESNHPCYCIYICICVSVMMTLDLVLYILVIWPWEGELKSDMLFL